MVSVVSVVPVVPGSVTVPRHWAADTAGRAAGGGRPAGVQTGRRGVARGPGVRSFSAGDTSPARCGAAATGTDVCATLESCSTQELQTGSLNSALLFVYIYPTLYTIVCHWVTC